MSSQDGGESRRTIVVRPAGGLAIVARVRGHEIATDQPVGAGGADSAVMPLELLGVALGTCVALYVGQFCRARDIPADDLRVEVDATSAREPSRIGRFSVRVLLPEGFPNHYREAIERVARTCPVHNTLAYAPTIDIATAAAEEAAAGV